MGVTPRCVLPLAVTLAVLAAGLVAIEAVRVGEWDLCLRLVLVAVVADGVDGALARRIRAQSALGGQLDSLADIVTFGAVPAFAFSTFYAGAPALLRFGVALAFVLSAAYRLARFGVVSPGAGFQGLPVTAAGPLLVLVTAGPFGSEPLTAGAVGLGLAALMISALPFPKVQPPRGWAPSAVTAAALPALVLLNADTVAVAAALVLLAYVAWGLSGWALAARGSEVRSDVRTRP